MCGNKELNTLVHVPTPGDHYSGSSGSAIMTIAYELNRQHVRAGLDCAVIVGNGTRADYPVGEVIRVPYAPRPNRLRKIADIAMGRSGFRRPFISGVYGPANTALSPDFNGVLIVHNGPAALRGFRIAYPKARICLYCHNYLFRTYSTSEMVRVLKDADHIVCVSNSLATQVRGKLGYEDPRIVVVLNGVDTERFVSAPTPAESAVPVILFVGRVLPIKGPDLLIRAIAKIADGTRRFKLRIVGSDNFTVNDAITPYERELRELARPVADYIEFVPFVDRDEVVRQYQSASVFCAPSNWDEPCSLTVPEAMACGLPTVASNRGGLTEVGAKAVLYFTPPNVDELAGQLAYLIDNPAIRASMRTRARKQAEMISWAVQYRVLQHLVLQH